MIENIGVTGVATTGRPLGREGGGGEIHSPEQEADGGEVGAGGGHDAEDFSAVHGEFAPVHGHAKPRDAGKATRTGAVAKASAGVEMVAAAGASVDGGAATVAAVGKGVTAETNDQVREEKCRTILRK